MIVPQYLYRQVSFEMQQKESNPKTLEYRNKLMNVKNN